MRQRWTQTAVAVILALLAVGVGWLYARPPLTSTGLGALHDLENRSRVYVYGIGLENGGRWPAVLTSVTVDGVPLESPAVMGVANRADLHLAENAVLNLEEHAHKLELGPVAGWRVHRRVGNQPGTYAVRLEWGKAEPPAEVVVHYRYLGLPMRYQVTDRWSFQ